MTEEGGRIDSVADLIEQLREGRMVVLMDDEDRENEGDLIMVAERARAEDINFMARNARGLICLTLSAERCERLALPLMVSQSAAPHGTNFTMSIEASRGVTTGISAADRAHTILAAVSPQAGPGDIVQPGHVFPLRAEPGGVLERAGHTEAGCDLARLAGAEPAAVIVEIMNEDGSMARRADLQAFAERHELRIGTIADLIEYRLLNEKTVDHIASGTIMTESGEFTLHRFKDRSRGGHHLALSMGEIDPDTPVPVRVQLPSTLRDVIGHLPDDVSGWNVRRCMREVAKAGAGAIVVLAGSETPEALVASVDVALGKGSAPAPGPRREYYLNIGIGAQILRALGVGKMRLMAAPMKYSVTGFGLEVTEYLDRPS